MLENAVAAHAAVFVEACDDGDVASKTVVAECFYGDSGVRAFKSGNVDGKGISVGICGRRALNFVEGWKYGCDGLVASTFCTFGNGFFSADVDDGENCSGKDCYAGQ